MVDPSIEKLTFVEAVSESKSLISKGVTPGVLMGVIELSTSLLAM